MLKLRFKGASFKSDIFNNEIKNRCTSNILIMVEKWIYFLVWKNSLQWIHSTEIAGWCLLKCLIRSQDFHLVNKMKYILRNEKEKKLHGFSVFEQKVFNQKPLISKVWIWLILYVVYLLYQVYIIYPTIFLNYSLNYNLVIPQMLVHLCTCMFPLNKWLQLLVMQPVCNQLPLPFPPAHLLKITLLLPSTTMLF